jgi:hypothetical protein
VALIPAPSSTRRGGHTKTKNVLISSFAAAASTNPNIADAVKEIKTDHEEMDPNPQVDGKAHRGIGMTDELSADAGCSPYGFCPACKQDDCGAGVAKGRTNSSAAI